MRPASHASAVVEPRNLFSYRKYWARRFGVATFLPTTAEEMHALGWDACDILLVTGDAYVDHPSFGMALIGRLLEAQGFRVAILAQPQWQSSDDFKRFGQPRLYIGVTAGNMDSMVNRYTADRRRRSDDAYTPNGMAAARPDRSVIVYSQRAREAYPNVPLIVGGIEASLRRIAHFDYWSEKVRRSILFDAKADLLLYGNAERALVEVSHRIAAGERCSEIRNVRGTAFALQRSEVVGMARGEVDSTTIDEPGPLAPPIDPYAMSQSPAPVASSETQVIRVPAAVPADRRDPTKSYVRMPSFEAVRDDEVLYAHASRVLHLESNPHNARPLVQSHGDRELWINPPPIPLNSDEMDRVYELPYQRRPHPSYGDAKIPAFEMIRFSVTIQRGCFGGCTFCSITEHEGRIIQNRSEKSVLREIEQIRDQVPGFTGVISDLGGPTANMYRLACKSAEVEAACRRLSCVFPSICSNLNTDHRPLIDLYRKARAVPGIKKVLIGSGVRYDLAVESPEYVKELVTHHVGGYLKIAPEHSESAPLAAMMKPGMGTYDRFKAMFDRFSAEAGKEQYLIPYFIAAHPGTRDEDMLALSLWLKANGFRADQVQAFLPSPMAMATAMYRSGKNPIHRVRRTSADVYIPKGLKQRRLHKAFLRYHDPNNWPLLREALQRMGRSDLIGNGKRHLVPTWQPQSAGDEGSAPAAHGLTRLRTQHVRARTTLPKRRRAAETSQSINKVKPSRKRT